MYGAKPAHQKAVGSQERDFTRLPIDSLRPTHYDIRVVLPIERPNDEEMEGETDITYQILRPTNFVLLNAHFLSIHKAVFRIAGALHPAKEIVKLDDEVVQIEFADGVIAPQPAGAPDPQLLLYHRASITSSAGGLAHRNGVFSREYFANEENRIGWWTQFEPCDARMVFPCVDEPNAKATFQLTLTHSAQQQALSNTLPESEEEFPLSDLSESDVVMAKRVRFGRTPLMSPYLLAFAVSHFDYLEKTIEVADGRDEAGQERGKKVLLRVCTPPGKKDEARLALLWAERAVTFFSEKLGVAYVLPKMDLICTPAHPGGAMENWGALMFSKDILLFDESEPHLHVSNARLICHEIAHQWFGNLVTCEWWQYLWLNEGFARYLEYTVIDHYEPTWHIWCEFLESVYTSSMCTDCGAHARAIEHHVRQPKEISRMFDTVTYQKGASIVRMLRHNLLGDNFWPSLQQYLHDKQWGSVTTTDLYSVLSRHLPALESVLSDWLRSAGHPLLTITRDPAAAHPGKTVFRLSQKLRSKDGAAQIPTAKIADAKSGASAYTLPLLVKPKGAPPQLRIVSGSSAEIEIAPALRDDDWASFNFGHAGYYVTCYSEEMWGQLATGVAEGELGVEDAFGFLLDGWSLLESGLVSAGAFLSLLRGYAPRTEPALWNVVLERLSWFRTISRGQTWTSHLCAFILQVCGTVRARIDVTDLSQRDYRQPLVALLWAAGDDALKATLLAAFWKLLDQPLPSSLSNTAIAIIQYGLLAGGQKEADAVSALAVVTPGLEDCLWYSSCESVLAERLSGLRSSGVYAPLNNAIRKSPVLAKFLWTRLPDMIKAGPDSQRGYLFTNLGLALVSALREGVWWPAYAADDGLSEIADLSRRCERDVADLRASVKEAATTAARHQHSLCTFFCVAPLP